MVERLVYTEAAESSNPSPPRFSNKKEEKKRTGNKKIYVGFIDHLKKRKGVHQEKEKYR